MEGVWKISESFKITLMGLVKCEPVPDSGHQVVNHYRNSINKTLFFLGHIRF